MYKVKNTAPMTSHSTTSGRPAPNTSMRKNTTLPMNDATGAVNALMAASMPDGASASAAAGTMPWIHAR